MNTRRPGVVVSYAQSIDGRIATVTGDSRWISGDATLELSQELRRDNDAILVGVGTILRDNPLLTCRLPDCSSPVRIVLDSRLRTPVDSQIVRTADRTRTVLFAAAGAGVADGGSSHAETLLSRGVEIVEIPAGSDGRIDLRHGMIALGKLGVESVYVEGGGQVITSFLAAGLVDRLIVVVAPMIIGRGVEAVGDLEVRTLNQALRPVSHHRYSRGDDLVWELTLTDRGAGS